MRDTMIRVDLAKCVFLLRSTDRSDPGRQQPQPGNLGNVMQRVECGELPSEGQSKIGASVWRIFQR